MVFGVWSESQVYSYKMILKYTIAYVAIFLNIYLWLPERWTDHRPQSAWQPAAEWIFSSGTWNCCITTDVLLWICYISGFYGIIWTFIVIFKLYIEQNVFSTAYLTGAIIIRMLCPTIVIRIMYESFLFIGASRRVAAHVFSRTHTDNTKEARWSIG